jgi:hypothetical protein
MNLIQAALAAIALLGPGEEFSYTQIAKSYGVVWSMLTQKHQSISSPRATRYENPQALYLQQGLELLRYIKRLTKHGLLPTQAMIQNFASQIAQKELGVH